MVTEDLRQAGAPTDSRVVTPAMTPSLAQESELIPSEKLEGMELPNDWTVVERICKRPGATGGHFSVGYKVRRKDGLEAFLKALDLSNAFAADDPLRELQELTETFNFERDLLERCRAKKLSNVVAAFEEGTITIDGLPVHYLIFELADCDIRVYMDVSGEVDLAWTLRMLHHVAVGLQQLHGIGIAHQDVKPSNVLVFEGLISKLADLGRSAHPDYQPPHHEFVIPGGYAYAPPELRYGYIDSDFNQRRFGCDTFLLGNIVLFAFTRFTMSAVLVSFLSPEHMKPNWKEGYHEVLPYLQAAFNEALKYVADHIPMEVRSEIVLMLRQLCEPDLSKRGHPLNRFGEKNNFSLERFITKLDLLAYKAERNLLR
jgi:eukaryotic-like serine/threonine-protein kinase